jgi:hypothetical protein
MREEVFMSIFNVHHYFFLKHDFEKGKLFNI